MSLGRKQPFPAMPGYVGHFQQAMADSIVAELTEIMREREQLTAERCDQLIAPVLQVAILSTTSTIVAYMRDYVAAHLGDAPAATQEVLAQLSEDILMQQPWEARAFQPPTRITTASGTLDRSLASIAELDDVHFVRKSKSEAEVRKEAFARVQAEFIAVDVSGMRMTMSGDLFALVSVVQAREVIGVGRTLLSAFDDLLAKLVLENKT